MTAFLEQSTISILIWKQETTLEDLKFFWDVCRILSNIYDGTFCLNR